MFSHKTKRTLSLLLILMFTFTFASLLLFGAAPSAQAGSPVGIQNPGAVCSGDDVLVSWDSAFNAALNWTGTTTGAYTIPDSVTPGSHTITGPGTFTIVIKDQVSLTIFYGPVIITCGGAAGPAWDHRVNPHPAEYYSIYCAFDLVSVYHGGDGTLLRSLPINDLAHMTDGGPPMDVGNGMTVARNGDVVTFAGSNGYGPAPSSKWFTLTECRQRNGGSAGDPVDNASPSLCTAGVWYCPDPENPGREAWNWDCGWWWGHFFAGLVDTVPDWCHIRRAN